MPTHALTDFTFTHEPMRPRHVELGYSVTGTLNAQGSNAILLPSFYTGGSGDYAGWIGAGSVFDPGEWFVVCADMFGNGRSESPSNTRHPDLAHHRITIGDNVRAQAGLLDALGVTSLAMVAGWSMGGMQAYEWAAAYPERVQSLLVVCASARCRPINWAFLEGLRQHLSPDRSGSSAGVEAFGRAYAAWAYSAAFFRDADYRSLGLATLAELFDRWAADHAGWDPRDLLAMLSTWQASDFTSTTMSAEERLRSIEAATTVMPCSSDMYFPADEVGEEARLLVRGHLDPITSSWGHAAGRPGLLPAVTSHIAGAARRLLNSRPIHA